jgi:hypothetical protein
VQIHVIQCLPRKFFPVPTAKARSGKNRDKSYYKEKALETCVFEQKYLSTDRLLGTTRELALILNMLSFPYKIIYKIIPIYTIKKLKCSLKLTNKYRITPITHKLK